MADINLLDNSASDKPGYALAGAGIAVKILIGVLLLVVLYYGYLRLQSSRTQKAIDDLRVQTAQAESEALTRTERGEVVTRQGQLQSLDGLIKDHFYWSGLLPELARVTLKSASYASLQAMSTGTLNLDVIVPSYADADKYLQVFDLPQFNEQFSDVKVLSISKVQSGSTVATQLKIQLRFNPEFIKKKLQ